MAATVLGVALTAQPAVAQAPVKIGLVTRCPARGGYLGEDVRDAFLLAIEQENGTLGGVPVRPPRRR